MVSSVLELLDHAVSGAAAARRVLAFWGPVTGDARAIVAPLVAIASVLMLAVLTGVAVGSLATLVTALMILYVLLTDVFGFTFDVTVA